MMDDHFTLQWNDYQNHLMNAFTSLRNDKDFVDLTLSCEGRKISSHKMLLSACSPYFRALLKENPCPHPVVILRQTSYEDLMAVIQFIYNGEVSLHQSRVKSFIKTAKSLKIRGLCEAEEFPADDNYSYNAEDGENGLKRGAFPPLRKKVKVEEGDEEEDFGGDSWSFDYPSNFHDEPASSMPGISEVPIRKRKAISIETKMNILNRSEQGETNAKISKEMGIAKSTISTIIKNGDMVKKLGNPLMKGTFNDVKRARSDKMHQMERILNMWIEEQNSMNEVINRPTIQEKAREVWVDIGGAEEEDENKKFVASKGWFERFRKRYNLCLIKNVDQ